MTDMTSAAARSRRPRRGGGFSLIEILVVLGILTLLMGIVIPAVLSAIKKANVTKTRADMAAMAQALEEYKNQHGGRYPQVPSDPNAPNTGFAVLGRELYGTYGDGFTGVPPSQQPDPADPPTYAAGTSYTAGDCIQMSNAGWVALVDNATPPAAGQYWASFNPHDNCDGPGIRTSPGGKKLGPYIQPERFRLQGCAFLDAYVDPAYQRGHPILYFPARGNVNISRPLNGGPSFLAAGVPGTKFDANDNIQFFIRSLSEGTTTINAVKRIQAMLGDRDCDGVINTNTGESAEHNGNYILWSPGPDGRYGPDSAAPTAQDISKCDDIIFTP